MPEYLTNLKNCFHLGDTSDMNSFYSSVAASQFMPTKHPSNLLIVTFVRYLKKLVTR